MYVYSGKQHILKKKTFFYRYQNNTARGGLSRKEIKKLINYISWLKALYREFTL